MIISETSLLDTNVLVYAADKNSTFYQASADLRENGVRGDVSLCVCPQVLNEFYATITDPRRVSNPRTQEEALSEMEKYLQSKNILKIYPGSEIIEKTIVLLKQHKTTRQDIFDLSLTATMLLNNITRIYTYNQNDFAKYKEIEVLTP